MDRPNMTNCRRTRGTEGRPWSRVDDEASMGLAAGTIGNWLTSGIVSFGYKHFWKIWIALLSICLVGYLVASQALLLVAISGLWIFLLPFFGFMMLLLAGSSVRFLGRRSERRSSYIRKTIIFSWLISSIVQGMPPMP